MTSRIVAIDFSHSRKQEIQPLHFTKSEQGGPKLLVQNPLAKNQLGNPFSHELKVSDAGHGVEQLVQIDPGHTEQRRAALTQAPGLIAREYYAPGFEAARGRIDDRRSGSPNLAAFTKDFDPNVLNVLGEAGEYASYAFSGGAVLGVKSILNAKSLLKSAKNFLEPKQFDPEKIASEKAARAAESAAAQKELNKRLAAQKYKKEHTNELSLSNAIDRILKGASGSTITPVLLRVRRNLSDVIERKNAYQEALDVLAKGRTMPNSVEKILGRDYLTYVPVELIQKDSRSHVEKEIILKNAVNKIENFMKAKAIPLPPRAIA